MPTLLLTATNAADPLPVGQWAALLAIGWLIYRLVLIVAFPNAPHGRCKGSGKRFKGKYFRPCRGCRGSGRKIRFGRQVWNWVVNTRASTK